MGYNKSNKYSNSALKIKKSKSITNYNKYINTCQKANIVYSDS